jgi:hypothetical protein
MVKIHIDTSPASKAKGKEKAKTTPATQATKPAPAASSGKTATPGKSGLPTKPPKEPKAPDDVVAARKRQSDVLKSKQNRETQGIFQAAPRDMDAGSGFWPPLSPLL